MRLGIGIDQGGLSYDKSLSRWVNLPGLCCQAAGGNPEWANDLTAAWILFYSAAHLMDKVQDQDKPDPWWQNLGPGVALSAATGLYFSASAALNMLQLNTQTNSAAADINENFYHQLLKMASGQYHGLSGPPQSLEDYWVSAVAKSGNFFALACWSGARLATSNPGLLGNYHDLGNQIGLLIQIIDDLEDILPLPGSEVPGQNKDLAYSLPAVYAISVSNADEQGQLRALIQGARSDPDAAHEAITLINQSGATTYILFELNRLSYEARQIIHRAAIPGPACDQLDELVSSLVKSKPFN